MRYLALVSDYDGTLAANSRVDAATLDALARVKRTGRRLILVTGRRLDDLGLVFPQLDLFDRIVAENGALLYRPATREERLLAAAPPEELARQLTARGADRVSTGRVIVATWRPFEHAALAAIRDLGLDLQIVFNREAVMILPSGINKATGLQGALLELGLSPHNAVAVGDAENDHAFLRLCECSVAVDNALDTLKDHADWVTRFGNGRGVVELIDALIASDLEQISSTRHRLSLGQRANGDDVSIPPYGTNVLITGASGAGKSTLGTGLFERLGDLGYQYLIVDPEGDYSTLDGVVALGDNRRAPNVIEVMDLLKKPGQNVAVNLIGMALEDRPKFFETLLPRIQVLRAKTGRPHWIVIDEVHHVLPASWEAAGLTVSQHVYGLTLITIEPNRVNPAILSAIDVVIATGERPYEMLRIFSETVGVEAPSDDSMDLGQGEAIVWFWRTDEPPFRFRSIPPRAERRRHRRKYAEGELDAELCFYFRGAKGTLNLKAQNLQVFLQIADGVDDETWLFHLRGGDFTRWFREAIKDPELAAAVERWERDPDITPEESRRNVRSQLEERYILAA